MLEAHGRGRLRITIRAAGSTITIRLQDDGPGIATEHGGSLRVESTPGRGAAFIIELAVAAGGRSILVVDDEPSIQGLLVEALAREGYKVDTAASGSSALAKIEKRHYDLIISDLKMPGVSGVDLYERIRETHPDLAAGIVFTSGDTVSAGTEAFLRRTGNMTLLKPFSLEELHASLGRFFGT